MESLRSIWMKPKRIMTLVGFVPRIEQKNQGNSLHWRLYKSR